MNTEQILMCVVALILGMLLANMLKSVCGCKVVEGQNGFIKDENRARAREREKEIERERARIQEECCIDDIIATPPPDRRLPDGGCPDLSITNVKDFCGEDFYNNLSPAALNNIVNSGN